MHGSPGGSGSVADIRLPVSYRRATLARALRILGTTGPGSRATSSLNCAVVPEGYRAVVANRPYPESLAAELRLQVGWLVGRTRVVDELAPRFVAVLEYLDREGSMTTAELAGLQGV